MSNLQDKVSEKLDKMMFSAMKSQLLDLKKKRSHTQKSQPKVVNPRDIAGNKEEEEENEEAMKLQWVLHIFLQDDKRTLTKLHSLRRKHDKCSHFLF